MALIFLHIYPLKTSENQRFSDVFRGDRKRPFPLTWVNVLNTVFILFQVSSKDTWRHLICSVVLFVTDFEQNLLNI